MSKISEIVNDPHYAKTLITENEFLWSDGTPKDTRTLEKIQEEHYKTLDYNQPGYKYQKPCVITGTNIGGKIVEIPYANWAQDNLDLDKKIIKEQRVLNKTQKQGAEIVEHPKHYNHGKYECIDVIDDLKLNFNLGSVLKYLWRVGLKDDEITELEKAKWYLEREIENRKKTK